MFRMTLTCTNGHAPRVMQPALKFDVVFCSECGNVNSALSVYKKWGGLIRSNMNPKGSL